MLLTEHNRRKLLRLMVVQEVSQRDVAKAAGYKSHSYMGRLLRGEVNTLEPVAAVRIAKFLGVGTDDLFMTKTTGFLGRTDRASA